MYIFHFWYVCAWFLDKYNLKMVVCFTLDIVSIRPRITSFSWYHNQKAHSIIKTTETSPYIFLFKTKYLTSLIDFSKRNFLNKLSFARLDVHNILLVIVIIGISFIASTRHIYDMYLKNFEQQCRNVLFLTNLIPLNVCWRRVITHQYLRFT